MSEKRKVVKETHDGDTGKTEKRPASTSGHSGHVQDGQYQHGFAQDGQWQHCQDMAPEEWEEDF